MKIGLITFYKDNFGSILQAYATYNWIEELGHKCEILDDEKKISKIERILKIPQYVFRSIYYKNYLKDKLLSKKKLNEAKNQLSLNTKKNMNEFIDNHFCINKCEKYKNLNRQYDRFIVGSDQVWGIYTKFNFLVFADREKRIAFSPSFGSDSLKEYYKKDIKKALKGFDMLSTREESGVEIIKDLIGKEAERLADPTLLFSRNDWEHFASKGIHESNYILLHFLDKPSDVSIKYINYYLKEHNCKVYSICNKYNEWNQINNCIFLDINPYDYVSLICNANYVFTDSFHSTLFSLNLETQFLTFERQYLFGDSQSSRIFDLLNRVSMLEKFVINDNDKINYDNEKNWNSDFLFYKERLNLKRYLESFVVI